MQETQVQSLGWENHLKKEMATHSSTLAWKIPWTEEPGRLQFMGLQRVGHDWATSLSLCFRFFSHIGHFCIEFLVLYSGFLLVIYFICSSVYMSISTSQFIPPPTYTLVTIVCLLYLWLYSYFVNRFICTMFSDVSMSFGVGQTWVEILIPPLNSYVTSEIYFLFQIAISSPGK